MWFDFHLLPTYYNGGFSLETLLCCTTLYHIIYHV